MLGRHKDAPWAEHDWRAALRQLHEAIARDLERIGIGRLCAQDLQNCLCEFDKHERTRLGEGKPKRRFVPSAETKQTKAALRTARGGLLLPRGCGPVRARPRARDSLGRAAAPYFPLFGR